MFKLHGFSLFELLIVITLITVVAGVSIPSYSHFIAVTRQQTVRSQLMHAISYARSEAMLREVPVSICGTEDFVNCSSSWQRGLMVFADDQIIYIFDYAIGDGVLHWRAAFNANFLRINPVSLMSDEHGTFWFCAGGGEKAAWAVMVSETGRAREVVDVVELQRFAC